MIRATYSDVHFFIYLTSVVMLLLLLLLSPVAVIQHLFLLRKKSDLISLSLIFERRSLLTFLLINSRCIEQSLPIRNMEYWRIRKVFVRDQKTFLSLFSLYPPPRLPLLSS
jgi:hypothetical protein